MKSETVYFGSKGLLLLAVSVVPGADTFSCLFAGFLSVIFAGIFAVVRS